MIFAGYSGLLHYLQLANHELATIGINVTKNEQSKSKCMHARTHTHTYAAIMVPEIGDF